MSMRGFLWLVALFAAAAALAILGQREAGQVIILYAPYRFELSLNLFIVSLIAAGIVLYVLIRLLSNLWKIPTRLRVYRTHARIAKAHAALRRAWEYLNSGRFARAEKSAQAACRVVENQDAAALVGARAAHQMREYACRDAWLARIKHVDWQEAKWVATAEMRLDTHDAAGALAALDEIQTCGARRLHAQQIALRAHRQLEHWDEILKVVKTLEARAAIDHAAAQQLRQSAAQHLVYQHRHDAQTLLECWSSLPASERETPSCALLAARLFVNCGAHQEARQIVEAALNKQWDARLLRCYVECAGDDPHPLIQRAEAWQAQHPNDPDVLFALGCLCQQQRLWGKAQILLEAALRITLDTDETSELKVLIHRALARLHESLDDNKKAYMHYREAARALKAA